MNELPFKEVQLQKQICEALNYAGCFCWRTNNGMMAVGQGKFKRMIRFGLAGCSDIIGINKKGKFLAVEVKLPKTRNNVSDLQQQFIDHIKEMHGVAGVATTIEEALEIAF